MSAQIQFIKPGVEKRLKAERAAILKAALRCVSKYGWKIFPGRVVGKSKRSHKSGRYSNGIAWGMTDDPEQIKHDFNAFRSKCLGVPTGLVNRIFVIEGDTKKGHNVDGLASIKALERKHGRLPATLMAVSPTGSVHRFYRHPGKGFRVKMSVSEIAPGVDIKGDGGMVFVPPSVRTDGTYRWLNKLPIADAPDWLLAFVCAESSGERSHNGSGRIRSSDAEQDPFDHFADGVRQQQTSIAELTLAMAMIPNPDHDWDTWNTVGMALFDATGGSDEGFKLFDAWSRWSTKYDETRTQAKWQALVRCPPRDRADSKKVTAGTIFFLAEEAVPEWRERMYEDPVVIARIDAFLELMDDD
jgi:Bifunctional DNA primase/polymerase, N-terminal/Primase C terminal 2 (PriCT-2)